VEVFPEALEVIGMTKKGRDRTHALFLANLEKLMSQRQWDAPALAKEWGRPAKSVYALCNGSVPPKFRYITELSDLFGVPASEFFRGPDELPSVGDSLETIIRALGLRGLQPPKK